VNGSTLVLPALGVFSRINSVVGVSPSPPLTGTPWPPAPSPPQYSLYTSPQTGATVTDLELILDVYPDANMGTATAYRTYHFGIYGVPVPLLAEGTVPLPKGIAADLQISYPPIPAPGPLRTQPDYDILFSPDGPTVSTTYVTANTNVFIWVRDVTKITNTTGSGPQNSMYAGDFGGNYAAFVDAFRRGGEQTIVGIRAGGFVGTAPVLPADKNGSFATYSVQYHYTLARQQLDK
jgi:hypothetical protein